MKLSKVRIKNYRLLIDTELDVDQKTTLIVGRNNTGKTSFFECIIKLLNNSSQNCSFNFDDYPISKRRSLIDSFSSFIKNEHSFDKLRENFKPISIEFLVDYSEDGIEDSLGALSPFIIDVDSDIDTALIRVEYKLLEDQQRIRRILKLESINNGTSSFDNDLRDAIKENFHRLFEMKVYAVNPSHPEEVQLKKLSELKELFPCYVIQAERRLGEDELKNDSLSELITEFFEMNQEDLPDSLNEDIKNLREIASNANKNLQKETEGILNKLVKNAVVFGYPNEEELHLKVTTNLSIDEQLKNKTQLSYTNGTDEEQLPSSHNGLGYKNLIKMMFLLSAFSKKMSKFEKSCIPLLFIEEPESHMHPQMQQTFALHLEVFMNSISGRGVQTFISSHSPHFANSTDFSKIRYAQRIKDHVIYKNLNTFANKDPKNIDFIKKYLCLTKCDLFFADKVILIEGTSERLLLPDMIAKCDLAGEFDSRTNKLTSQYYSLIEVGGAWAHKFIGFMEFLDVPCLIITDLDPLKNGKSSLVCEGETTSNETIKWWIRQHKGIAEDDTRMITLNEIKELSSEGKTRGKCHIEFQTEEKGLYGKSFEEAIRNVNRTHYQLKEDIVEEELRFTGKCKPEFALKLIYECKDYVIPDYIKSGLKWLNDQLVFE